MLPRQKFGGGEGAGVETVLRQIDSHANQFFPQLARSAFARIGQKNEFPVMPGHPVDKLLRPRQQLVAVVDDAIHIEDEGGLIENPIHKMHLSFRRDNISRPFEHFHRRDPPAHFLQKKTDARRQYRTPATRNIRYFFREKISLNWSIPLLISWESPSPLFWRELPRSFR